MIVLVAAVVGAIFLAYVFVDPDYGPEPDVPWEDDE